MKSELEIVVESALDALGFDLVDLRRGGSRARPMVEIRIDRRDGEAVTVDDCARVSRAIEHVVGEQTELQVSSPGADRPLKTEKDWRRFVGRRALVKSAALGGRQEVEIAEVNGTGDDFVVTLRQIGGDRRAPKKGGAAAGAPGKEATKSGEAAEAADQGRRHGALPAPSGEAVKAADQRQRHGASPAPSGEAAEAADQGRRHGASPAAGGEAATGADQGGRHGPPPAPSREAAKAREYQLPLSAIDEARLTFHWDRGVTDGRFR